MSYTPSQPVVFNEIVDGEVFEQITETRERYYVAEVRPDGVVISRSGAGINMDEAQEYLDLYLKNERLYFASQGYRVVLMKETQVTTATSEIMSTH